MKKVILTKPGNASKEISKQLEKAGLSKDALLVWPAFSFRKPYAPDTETILNGADLGAVLVVVSPTAAQFLYDQLPNFPKDTQFAAVGEPTAKKIEALYKPIKPVIFPSGSVDVSGSERLFEVFEAMGLPERVVIVRGQTGRGYLFEALQERGVSVSKAVIYERVPFQLSTSEKAKVSPSDALIVLVTSTDAVNHLWESLGQEFADSLRNAAYFTIHHRIAERLKSLGAGKVTIYDSAKDNIVQLIADTAS